MTDAALFLMPIAYLMGSALLFDQRMYFLENVKKVYCWVVASHAFLIVVIDGFLVKALKNIC